MTVVRSNLMSVTMMLGLAAQPAAAQQVLGLVQGANQLVRINSANPTALVSTTAITGVVGGDTLRAIDYRPATGQLYMLATDAGNTGVRTYLLNAATGAATAMGGIVALTTPATNWDINFNPTVDRIRVVNDADENARLNPDNGVLAGDDTNLTAGATVDAVAYTNPFAGATQTTLYALNRATNSLATIGGLNGNPSPNGGVVTNIGPLGVAFGGAQTAFDIATNNTALAVLRVAGLSSLFTVNLATGAATLRGTVGDGSLEIADIAIVDPGLSISPPTGTYTTRQVFDIVLLADPQGASVASGSVLFNGLDVTGIIASCVRVGSTGSMVSLRCPNVGGPVMGPGTHIFLVRLQLSDGTSVQRSVTWTVLPVVEP